MEHITRLSNRCRASVPDAIPLESLRYSERGKCRLIDG
jgi:hypothetical protein